VSACERDEANRRTASRQKQPSAQWRWALAKRRTPACEQPTFGFLPDPACAALTEWAVDASHCAACVVACLSQIAALPASCWPMTAFVALFAESSGAASSWLNGWRCRH